LIFPVFFFRLPPLPLPSAKIRRFRGLWAKEWAKGNRSGIFPIGGFAVSSRGGKGRRFGGGVADFHAAGRQTHITELLRNGGSPPEAKELARHTDVNLTTRYTHIGLQRQAKALANLPAPSTAWLQSGQQICCPNRLSETSPDTSVPERTPPPETTKPRGSRGCVADCPDLSLVDKESEEWRRRELNPGLGVLQRRLLRV
jgi:hypothetical protein